MGAHANLHLLLDTSSNNYTPLSLRLNRLCCEHPDVDFVINRPVHAIPVPSADPLLLAYTKFEDQTKS